MEIRDQQSNIIYKSAHYGGKAEENIIIKTTLKRYREEIVMRFFRELEIFEEI